MNSKHMLIMLLCCLVPLAGIFAASVLGISLGSLGTVAMLALCPLMHVLMMRGMGGHDHQGQDRHPVASTSSETHTVATK